jgi:hypothetical protein
MFARTAFSAASKVTRRTLSTYKTSTGMVGLAVEVDGRAKLLEISNEILESVKVRDYYNH